MGCCGGCAGAALLPDHGFSEHGFEIVAALGSDRRKIGGRKGGITIWDIEDVKKVVKARKIGLAIIAVPAHAAQEAAEKLVNSGIKAILNFAPVMLKVPQSVHLLNIDMSVQPHRLSYLASRTDGER